MKPGEKTKLEDLALLCGNCHRIAHRRKEVISVAEIRAVLVK
jgi:5-methylcytosine-specific restriction protein A